MKAFLRKNYCWVIAMTVLIGYAVRAGLTNNLNSLYLVPVSEGLSASRTSVSFAASLRSIGTFLSNATFGLVYKKFGFRKLAFCGLLVMGLSFFGLASSTTVLAYCLFAMLLGLFEATYSTAAISKLVGEWFVKYRGTILGVITAASGLGASFFAIILTNIMQEKGWRASQYFAGALIIIAAIAVFLLVREKPSEMGLVPYGADAAELSAKKGKKKKLPDFEGFSMERLKRSPVLWLFLLSAFLAAACTYAPYQILFSCLMDKGVAPEDAARIQSLMFLLLAGTKILDGTLCDLIGAKPVFVISTISVGLGALLLCSVNSLGSAILPTLLISIGLPLTTLLPALSTSAILGKRTYDTMVGMALAAVAVANMVVNPLMNSAFDRFGTYDVGLRVAAAVAFTSVLLYLFLCRLAKKELDAIQTVS